ncbi:MAG TPA: LysR family transcriptional regulator [Xanthobacteraceae bacterium]|jgi:DNA-binding transcriptional LysR family regulator|nr:LysR family transcriptional regulator [Xanthobacteraceae bacterium]
MGRRHLSGNVPLELLRSLVAVVDCESYTKAARKLHLTQPAVSAQMNRLREILGGEIFEKGPGARLTKRGMLAVGSARRMLDINDQLLADAGRTLAKGQLLVGLPSWFSYYRLREVVAQCLGAVGDDQLIFRCDQMESLMRGLATGTIDVAYLCMVSQTPAPAIVEWQEPMVWVKSPKLELTPGEPLPLVTWPGSLPDRLAGELLGAAGLAHVCTFAAPDHQSRQAAVAAGAGIMIVTDRSITPDMQVAREPFLPKPAAIKTGLYRREGLDPRRIKDQLQTLVAALEPRAILESEPARRRS